MQLLQRLLLPSICCLALLRYVDALSLNRRDCTSCPEPPQACASPCKTDETCVLVPRTCDTCSTRTCKPINKLIISSAGMTADPDTPKQVDNNSSGFSYTVMAVCGAGVAGLLAAGLFVLREKKAQQSELEKQRRHDSYLASDKDSAKRGATAVTSVECDFGAEKHMERQNEMLALQEQIMYGNPSDIAASLAKGPAAMATVNRPSSNAPDKTPLLPAPSLYFSNNNCPSDDINGVEEEEAKEDVEALPSLSSPISAAYRRASRVQKTFSATSNNLQFPHVPTSTPLGSNNELRDSFGFGLPDIPSSASVKNERLAGRRRSLADVSSKTLSQAGLQIRTSFSPGFGAPSKRLSPVGNFQLMRSESGGHNRTVSDALGNSGDRLSSVGTNSFSRVASTIQPPTGGGGSRSVGMHSRTSSLGSVSRGELPPTELEILKRPKSERERRRESMVREAMKRASVEHVLVTPGGGGNSN